MIQRYRIAFLLSSLVFISFWAVYLNLPVVEKKIKKIEKKVIQISIVTPAIPKKTIVKKVEPIPKPKPKKVVKKKIIKKKIVKKKIIKKKVVKKKIIKKPKPKKIIKKRVIKKKVVKQYIPEPIIEPYVPMKKPVKTHVPPPAPPVYVVPKPKVEPVIKPTRVAPKVNSNNGQARKAFLRNVRSKIIANKKYPKIAKRRHIEGSVKVQFDITKHGHVTNIRFINGKRVFHKSIRKTLENTFPMGIPDNVKSELPISDVSVVLHFNIR